MTTVRITGIKITAWGLRNLPRATNFLANQTARIAGRIKEGYRFGQTRFEARVYNSINYQTARQVEIEEAAVKNILETYWTGLTKAIEQADDGSGFIDSLRTVTQQLTPSPTTRKVKAAVALYSHRFFLEHSDTPYGYPFVCAAIEKISNGMRENGVPKKVVDPLCENNQFTWFVKEFSYVLRDYLSQGKHAYQFWPDQRVTSLPPNFYNQCRGWE